MNEWLLVLVIIGGPILFHLIDRWHDRRCLRQFREELLQGLRSGRITPPKGL